MPLTPEKIAEVQKDWEAFSEKNKTIPSNAGSVKRSDFAMQLANELKNARKQAKLSQTELARRLKITPAVVSRLETGRAKITLERLKQYAEVSGGKLEVKITFNPNP